MAMVSVPSEPAAQSSAEIGCDVKKRDHVKRPASRKNSKQQESQADRQDQRIINCPSDVVVQAREYQAGAEHEKKRCKVPVSLLAMHVHRHEKQKQAAGQRRYTPVERIMDCGGAKEAVDVQQGKKKQGRPLQCEECQQLLDRQRAEDNHGAQSRIVSVE